MLHFNEPWSRAADGAGAENDGGDAAENDADGAGAAETWKVLVYDTFGRDVISPILRVGDLREQAVTLHMYGTAPRRAHGRSSDGGSRALFGRGLRAVVRTGALWMAWAGNSMPWAGTL